MQIASYFTIIINDKIKLHKLFQIFKRIATHSYEPYTISDAVEEFFAEVIAMPPGHCSTETRWEPKENTEVNFFNIIFTMKELPLKTTRKLRKYDCDASFALIFKIIYSLKD